jgi:nucleoside-diphosphate-sugar epimerase
MPQPVAITGGTGFIGSHLVDTLCEAELRPRVLVRDADRPRWIADRPVEWVCGTLADVPALESLIAGARTVFHLAGVVTADNAAGYDQGNRVGTETVLGVVRDRAPNARFVLVSSLAAVGPSDDPGGLDPDATPAPISDYGRSKLAAEEATRQWGGDGWWSIVRLPAVYGPRDIGVFEFFKMIRRGIALIPAGDRWVSVIHVADAVRGILAAASPSLPRRVFHLAEPESYRMADLIAQLAEAGDRRAKILRVPTPMVATIGTVSSALRVLGLHRGALTRDKAREIAARHWTVRSSTSLDELGLEITVPFSEGARATWAWYRSHGWLS